MCASAGGGHGRDNMLIQPAFNAHNGLPIIPKTR
jgi:hypothetical protein